MTAHAPAQPLEMRFGFGQNWAEFVDRNFTDDRVRVSQDHLLGFLHLDDLRGRTMLDIGSGSGLSSLAALRAGAERIVSFDYDPDSVATTRRLRARAGDPGHWEVVQGSVLDRAFVQSLGTFDIVYSWGVLHHTGAMWDAIRNAALPMHDESVFYIALYTTDVHIDPTPEQWLALKQAYNRAGAARKRLMEWDYAWRFTVKPALRARHNPLKTILGYSKSRGMAYWTDVRDWLGGWPMEFAGITETKAFAQHLGLEMLHIRAGDANTEYLFRKQGASNYWDLVQASTPQHTLAGPFVHRGGHAYVAELPTEASSGDSNEDPRRSQLMLYEDGVPIGFAHQPHDHIVAYGGGRYSHWNGQLVFSSTDNSDPNCNGRAYTYAPTAL